MMNMIQYCSVSKKAKLDDSGGADLLSDLPLSIIHIILALIPIRDAVRTSVLSTEWRYTWTTLPQLVFDYECASEDDESESKYEDIILQVLSLHKGPIRRFRLSCFGHFRYVDQWLTCLSRNGIQEIIIDSSMVMQSSLYSCEMLTHLSLHHCALKPPAMTFKGFLFLRCLCIIGVISLTSDDISRIVAGCPLLEGFALNGLVDAPKISAPNLKYVRLVGNHKKICINAPHMTEIGIFMRNYQPYHMEVPHQQLKNLACEYASCFAGFTNLQKLTGIGYFTKFMSLGIELCHHSFVFHHLKLIHVNVDFKNVKEIMVLARFVIGAPSLQELIINSMSSNGISDSEAPHSSLEDLGFAPDFKLKSLTDVSLRYLHAFPLEDEFLKILFEMSPVLETVRVETEEDQNKVWAILQWRNWISGLSPPIVTLGDKRRSPDTFRKPF